MEIYLKDGAAKSDLNVEADLLKFIKTTRDQCNSIMSDILAIEKFISLNFPAIEDGNNFGVSVQLSILKMLKESRTILSTQLASIGPSYFEARANCIDKIGLKQKSVSSTSTTNQSSSTSSKSEGDEEKEEKTSSSSSTEEKETGPGVVSSYRLYQLLAIDLKAYSDAKTALTMLVDEYLSILDNVEKNYEKLSAPKGSSGGNNHMGMF